MGSDAISIASSLLDAGNADTMYRDVYLGRARTLLSPVVSLEAFHGMEQRRSALASLPLAVARALEKADWPQVRDLDAGSPGRAGSPSPRAAERACGAPPVCVESALG